MQILNTQMSDKEMFFESDEDMDEIEKSMSHYHCNNNNNPESIHLANIQLAIVRNKDDIEKILIQMGKLNVHYLMDVKDVK